MSAKSFTQWVISEGRDIFGFEKRLKKQEDKHADDMPINPIDSELIIAELLRMPPLGIKEAHYTLKNHIVWGKNSSNPLLVDIGPLGSYKMIIRKKLTDLEGNDAWVCKHVEPLIETDNDSNEIPLAHKVYERLQMIDKQTDSANHEYDLENLSLHLAFRIKKQHPKVMLFDKIRRMAENHFLITMNMCGHGAEAPGQTRVEQYHINTVFYPNNGLIRIWANEITSPMRQHLWSISPAEFDEYFAPSQDRLQIENTFLNALSTY